MNESSRNAKCMLCGTPLRLLSTPGLGPMWCWSCHPAREQQVAEDEERVRLSLARRKAKADRELREYEK